MKKTVAENRERRRRLSRIKTFGTADYPRLVIFRGNRFIYLQVVDDANNKVLKGFDSRKIKAVSGVAAAAELGKMAGISLLREGIKQARFDRAGYPYHGQVKAVVEGLREAGVKI
jgi:large subunit ribosomal protein L18